MAFNVFAALLNSITRLYHSLAVCKETLCLLILTLIKQVSKGQPRKFENATTKEKPWTSLPHVWSHVAPRFSRVRSPRRQVKFYVAYIPRSCKDHSDNFTQKP